MSSSPVTLNANRVLCSRSSATRESRRSRASVSHRPGSYYGASSHSLAASFGSNGVRQQRRSKLSHERQPKANRTKILCAEAVPEGQSVVSADGGPIEYSLPRADEQLPKNLLDSVCQAATCCGIAGSKGEGRVIAELLIPELWDPISGPVMAEEGDQMRWWELAREFLIRTKEACKSQETVAVFPDIGVSAMLAARWQAECPFKCMDPNDPRILSEDTDLIIITCPDPRGVESIRKIVDRASEQGVRVVMFNPRLASGDVGIGTNIRELRNEFVDTFTTAYSIRPLTYPNGTVFRKYPAQWQVLLEDHEVVNKFNLVYEGPSRPGGEPLDLIIDSYMDKAGRKNDGEDDGNDSNDGPSLMSQVNTAFKGMQRFMKALSN
eukprot:CAMPEP_0197856964 /NCGR_PEP_ID=MMETSP1438-20131217/29568_1 /TAXON_ID=1461541 /ORGANISM="Pterosperma sp., Strain CCMP1384" /LENGTH=379 /DNA_ID=CAMNT_0043472615 /DNA_START=204 /DNA_END=1343 /DNA_ORIENTATION=-